MFFTDTALLSQPKHYTTLQFLLIFFTHYIHPLSHNINHTLWEIIRISQVPPCGILQVAVPVGLVPHPADPQLVLRLPVSNHNHGLTLLLWSIVQLREPVYPILIDYLIRIV